MSLKSHASHSGRRTCCGPLDAMLSEGMVQRVFRQTKAPPPLFTSPPQKVVDGVHFVPLHLTSSSNDWQSSHPLNIAGIRLVETGT